MHAWKRRRRATPVQIQDQSPETTRYNKLYVVVRDDLLPGQQAAQAVHAAFQFALEHSETSADWHPGTLIVLSADRDQFFVARAYAILCGIEHSIFIEPDYEPWPEVYAIALAPGAASASIVSHLPLALRENQSWRRLNTVAKSHAGGRLNTALRHHVSGGLGKTGRLLIRLKRVRIPSGTRS